MAPQLHDLGRALQARLIAMAAGTQTVGQLVVSAARHDWFDVVVWLSATVVLVFLAIGIESIKRFLGE